MDSTGNQRKRGSRLAKNTNETEGISSILINESIDVAEVSDVTISPPMVEESEITNNAPTSECRRSSRKKIIKFDVRDLLNKNRKPHKIQIEARIDSNAPTVSKISIPGVGESANSTQSTAVREDLLSKQKTFLEKSAIFRRYSTSQEHKPPPPPLPIPPLLGKANNNKDDKISGAPISKRLSRNQEFFSNAMIKPKQTTSLIVAQIESNAPCQTSTKRKSLNKSTESETKIIINAPVVQQKKRGRPAKAKTQVFNECDSARSKRNEMASKKITEKATNWKEYKECLAQQIKSKEENVKCEINAEHSSPGFELPEENKISKPLASLSSHSSEQLISEETFKNDDILKLDGSYKLKENETEEKCEEIKNPVILKECDDGNPHLNTFEILNDTETSMSELLKDDTNNILDEKIYNISIMSSNQEHTSMEKVTNFKGEQNECFKNEVASKDETKQFSTDENIKTKSTKNIISQHLLESEICESEKSQTTPSNIHQIETTNDVNNIICTEGGSIIIQCDILPRNKSAPIEKEKAANSQSKCDVVECEMVEASTIGKDIILEIQSDKQSEESIPEEYTTGTYGMEIETKKNFSDGNKREIKTIDILANTAQIMEGSNQTFEQKASDISLLTTDNSMSQPSTPQEETTKTFSHNSSSSESENVSERSSYSSAPSSTSQFSSRSYKSGDKLRVSIKRISLPKSPSKSSQTSTSEELNNSNNPDIIKITPPFAKRLKRLHKKFIKMEKITDKTENIDDCFQRISNEENADLTPCINRDISNELITNNQGDKSEICVLSSKQPITECEEVEFTLEISKDSTNEYQKVETQNKFNTPEEYNAKAKILTSDMLDSISINLDEESENPIASTEKGSNETTTTMEGKSLRKLEESGDELKNDNIDQQTMPKKNTECIRSQLENEYDNEFEINKKLSETNIDNLKELGEMKEEETILKIIEQRRIDREKSLENVQESDVEMKNQYQKRCINIMRNEMEDQIDMKEKMENKLIEKIDTEIILTTKDKIEIPIEETLMVKENITEGLEVISFEGKMKEIPQQSLLKDKFNTQTNPIETKPSKIDNNKDNVYTKQEDNSKIYPIVRLTTEEQTPTDESLENVVVESDIECITETYEFPLKMTIDKNPESSLDTTSIIEAPSIDSTNLSQLKIHVKDNIINEDSDPLPKESDTSSDVPNTSIQEEDRLVKNHGVEKNIKMHKRRGKKRFKNLHSRDVESETDSSTGKQTPVSTLAAKYIVKDIEENLDKGIEFRETQKPQTEAETELRKNETLYKIVESDQTLDRNEGGESKIVEENNVQEKDENVESLSCSKEKSSNLLSSQIQNVSIETNTLLDILRTVQSNTEAALKANKTIPKVIAFDSEIENKNITTNEEISKTEIYAECSAMSHELLKNAQSKLSKPLTKLESESKTNSPIPSDTELALRKVALSPTRSECASPLSLKRVPLSPTRSNSSSPLTVKKVTRRYERRSRRGEDSSHKTLEETFAEIAEQSSKAVLAAKEYDINDQMTYEKIEPEIIKTSTESEEVLINSTFEALNIQTTLETKTASESYLQEDKIAEEMGIKTENLLQTQESFKVTSARRGRKSRNRALQLPVSVTNEFEIGKLKNKNETDLIEAQEDLIETGDTEISRKFDLENISLTENVVQKQDEAKNENKTNDLEITKETQIAIASDISQKESYEENNCKILEDLSKQERVCDLLMEQGNSLEENTCGKLAKKPYTFIERPDDVLADLSYDADDKKCDVYKEISDTVLEDTLVLDNENRNRTPKKSTKNQDISKEELGSVAEGTSLLNDTDENKTPKRNMKKPGTSKEVPEAIAEDCINDNIMPKKPDRKCDTPKEVLELVSEDCYLLDASDSKITQKVEEICNSLREIPETVVEDNVLSDNANDNKTDKNLVKKCDTSKELPQTGMEDTILSDDGSDSKIYKKVIKKLDTSKELPEAAAEDTSFLDEANDNKILKKAVKKRDTSKELTEDTSHLDDTNYNRVSKKAIKKREISKEVPEDVVEDISVLEAANKDKEDDVRTPKQSSKKRDSSQIKNETKPSGKKIQKKNKSNEDVPSNLSKDDTIPKTAGTPPPTKRGRKPKTQQETPQSINSIKKKNKKDISADNVEEDIPEENRKLFDSENESVNSMDKSLEEKLSKKKRQKKLKEAFEAALTEEIEKSKDVLPTESTVSTFNFGLTLLNKSPPSQRRASTTNNSVEESAKITCITPVETEDLDPLKDIEKFIADGVNLLKKDYKLDEDSVGDVIANTQGKTNELAETSVKSTDDEEKTIYNTFETPADTPINTPSTTPPPKSPTSVESSTPDENSGVRRSHRIKLITKTPKALVGRGLVRDKERFSIKDDVETKCHYTLDDHLTDLAEVEAKNAKFLKDMEERLSNFQVIKENEYLCERVISREAKKMICDCFLTHEEEERGELGCGEDCLNRLLMIECGPDCNVKERCTNKRFQKLLCSPCRVFRTEKKGFGIMADIEILPGEFIMEYVGEVIDTDEFEKRRIMYSQDKNRHYYFMALRSDAIIDATIKGNISRFINHSCDPNAETQKWTVNGELRIGFFSRKSIMPGEEITFNYQYQRYGREAQRCYCESTNCRGWIGQEPTSDEGEQIDDDDEDDESEEEGADTSNLLVQDDDEDSDTSVTDPEEVQKQLEMAAAQAEVELAPLQLMEEKTKQEESIQTEGKSTHDANKSETEEDSKSKFKKLLSKMAEKVAKQKQNKREQKLQRKKKSKESSSDISNMLKFLEDPDIEDEVEFLKECGLKNQSDTLRLSRLMVRAKLVQTRLNLLEILRKGELPCRRLFLDYHGLRLLHGWMSEDAGNMQIRLSLLQTLETLPVANKTVLTDSKVMQMVRSWCGSNTNLSPNEDSSSSNSNSQDIPVQPSSNLEEGSELVELQKLSVKLITTWEGLPEIFRIPKKERIEQMKEHEREADRQYAANAETEKNTISSNCYRRDRFGRGLNSCSSSQNTSNRFIKPNNGNPLRATNIKHLSKDQRRQMFAAKVARDEAEKRLAEERREFETKCRFFGLDPKKTRLQDIPFCVNPATGQWFSIERKAITTPPSYAHVQVPVKPKSTDPNDYQLPVACSTLPPQWKYAITAQGKIYYYHIKHRIPQWEPPTLDQLQRCEIEDQEEDSESEMATTAGEDSSDDDDEILIDMDAAQLKAYIDRKVEIRRQKRYQRLVDERSISPRREEDRIYNQIEVRKYKENKEKIRKRKEEIRRRRAELLRQTSLNMCTLGSIADTNSSANKSQTESDEELGALPIQDYLLSSDEEVDLKVEVNSPLMDKIVEGDKIVDELDALTIKRQLKRPLPPHRDVNEPSTSSVSSVSAAIVRLEYKKRKLEKKEKRKPKEQDAKYRKNKEKFRCEIAGIIVHHLKPYRKETCTVGRIQSNEDFNHLARKLTHFVMIKELKYCESVGQTLVVTESVKNKSREFIKKYMAKYGDVYVKPSNDPEFKDIPFTL